MPSPPTYLTPRELFRSRFVGGSLTSPGALESYEHRLKKDHPLRALFLADRSGPAKPEPTCNMLPKHGVRACLEYANASTSPAPARCPNRGNPGKSGDTIPNWPLLMRRRRTLKRHGKPKQGK